MAAVPSNKQDPSDEDFDFDFDIEDLDDQTLQRLLDEDPVLEEDLRAIEDAEIDPEVAPMGGLLSGNRSAPKPEPEQDDWAASRPPHDDIFESPEDPFDDGVDEQSLTPEAEAPEDAGAPRAVPTEAGPPPVIDDAFPNETTAPSEDGEETDAQLAALEAAAAALDAEEELSGLELYPVPRINIHAFCTTQGTMGLLERAAGDRRLAKAHVTINSGDARHAAEVYADEATPNLLIVESDGATENLLRGLDDLASVCDPSTKVIVVGWINDIRLYRELMDRGVSEYLVTPRSPLQFIASIGQLYADPSVGTIGKSYVFAGSRGGVGSSTVCHNVAWAISETMATDTILMDFDLAFGTAALDFEHDPSQGLAEALGAPERLDDVLLDRLLQKCSERLSLFAAPNMLDRDYMLPSDAYDSVLDVVRKAAPAIMVDLPHLWAPWARDVLFAADEIVLTATPDLASFRNAKNICETLVGRRQNDADPILVLNQMGVAKRPEVPAEQFEDALGIKVFTEICWEPVLFGTAATNAEALGQHAPKSKPTQAMADIAARLLGRTPQQETKGFSLKSLFAKKR